MFLQFKKEGIDVEVWRITNNINNNKHNHIYKLILLKQNQILNFLDKKIINNKQHLKKKLYFIFIQFISMTFIKYQKKYKILDQMDFISSWWVCI